MNNRQNILYVHYGDNWLRGSEHCLVNLLGQLNLHQYRPYLWTNNPALHHVALRNDVPSILDSFPVLLGWSSNKFNAFGWLKLVHRGLKMVKENQIDLIHINSGAPCQWMCLVGRLAGIPVVTQLHSDYPLRDRLTLGLHLSPRIITVSKAISYNLIKDGYPVEQLSVVHNGIDTAQASASEVNDAIQGNALNARRHLGISESATVFVTVGSLIYRKGVDRIINALFQLKQSNPDLHLIVIGDGCEKDTLIKQAQTVGLASRIHFVGEQHNVQDWLTGGVDAFISAARSEAFGLVVAEAGMARLPILAPDTGGIPEIITDGKTGILYSNNDDADLTNAITRFLDGQLSPEHPNKTLASNAQKHIHGTFTLAINCQKIERIYQQALNESINSHGDFQPSWFSGLRPLRRLPTTLMMRG
ncbi:glycosyltransferase [Vibrio tapetis]|uniref:Putative galactosyltransferase n=1 Tax=Vibrio tapetis subsp. tapetis TaxID=1671868 RepID=A0A2N8ZMF8_9VIBR|nr:glycosyltransferase [Vibrio tapetis]SON53124.1 putative galactosyltransferase [Vibrio tapetis subsp. tapetis]